MKRLFLFIFAGTLSLVQADESVLPGAGFPASRYETLWSKSPFAVASDEAVAAASPDYSLVGVAQIEGVSYVSVIDTHSNEHFVVTSDKPVRGITLVSVTRGQTTDATTALVQLGGQNLTLKMDPSLANPPPGTVPTVQPLPGVPQAGMVPPQAVPTDTPGDQPPPFVRRHPHVIRIPLPPGATQPPHPAGSP